MPSQESGLVTRSIPKVTGGVSQKPAAVRDSSQCTALTNFLPDPVLGLTRRRSSDFLCTLAGYNTAHFLYTFSFSATEQYALFIKDEALKVVDLINRTEMTVTVAGGAEEYLDISGGSAKSLKAVTIGNETFIANSSITVADDGTTSDADVPQALVWVRLGDQATAYTLTLDGTDYDLTTDTTARWEIDTRRIAHGLNVRIPQGRALSLITPSGVWAAGDSITITETVTGKTGTLAVFPRLSPPGMILLDINDEIGGAMFAEAGHLGDLVTGGQVDLPNNSIIGSSLVLWGGVSGNNLHFTSSVTSSGGALTITNFGVMADTYEVTQKASSLIIKKEDPLNPGSFIDFSIAVSDGLGSQALECFKAETQRFSDLPLNAAEGMKLRITGELISEVDDFYVQYTETDSPNNAGVWVESLKGGELKALDAATMPHVLTPDGMGGWNFGPASWSERLTGSLVTNPFPSFVGRQIDDMFFYKNRLGFVSGESICLSQSGAYFNFFRKSVASLLDADRIDVSSNSAQVNKIKFATFQESELILWGDQGQSTVSGTPLLTPKTIAEDPAGAFKTSTTVRPVQSGKFSYFVNSIGGSGQLCEYFSVDAAKPRKDVLDLTEEVPSFIDGVPYALAVCPESGQIFIQKTGGNELFVCTRGTKGIAWSKWTFQGTLRAFAVQDSTLVLSIERGTTLFVETMPLTPAVQTRYLDCSISTGYSAALATGITTWTLPFAIPIDADYPLVVLRQDTGAVIATNARTLTNKIAATGSFAAVDVFIGIKFPTDWELSTIYVTDPQPDGTTIALTDGRLQVRFLEVTFNSTGYFTATVTPNTDDPGTSYTYTFAGVTDNDKGVFKVPVLAQNDKALIVIGGTSHRPVSILGLSWTGYLSQKTKRI